MNLRRQRVCQARAQSKLSREGCSWKEEEERECEREDDARLERCRDVGCLQHGLCALEGSATKEGHPAESSAPCSCSTGEKQVSEASLLKPGGREGENAPRLGVLEALLDCVLARVVDEVLGRERRNGRLACESRQRCGRVRPPSSRDTAPQAVRRTRNDLCELDCLVCDTLLSTRDNPAHEPELLRLGRSKVARREGQLSNERRVGRHARETLERADVGGEGNVDFLCEGKRGISSARTKARRESVEDIGRTLMAKMLPSAQKRTSAALMMSMPAPRQRP